MDITEKAKKIVASSVAGLGVLGSILGMGLKGKAADDNQTLADVAQKLQANSQDLLALAKQLQGKEGASLQSVGEYISKLASKVAKGEIPTGEEIKQAQAKLENIKLTETPRHTDTPEADKQDKNTDDNRGDKTSNVGVEGRGRNSQEDTRDTDGDRVRKSQEGRETENQSPFPVGKSEKQDDKDKTSHPQGKSEKGDVGVDNHKPPFGKPPVKGGGDDKDKTTPTTEEMAENIQNALQKIEEIGAKLEQLEKAIADLIEKSDSKAEELEESGKQLDSLSQDLSDKAASSEAAIDSGEEETLQQFQESHQTLQQLSQTLIEVEEEATNTVGEAISQMNSQQQFFQDNLDRIIYIIRQLLQQQDAKDDNVNPEAKLTEVMENLQQSFSFFPQLLEDIDIQMETQKEETEENINNLIQTIHQGESAIKQMAEEIANCIADTTSKIEESCQQIHDGITATTNRFIDSNSQWQLQFQTTTSSLIENLENLVEDANYTNIEDNFPIDKLTETLQQQEENRRQIQEVASCFRQLTEISENLVYASEIAKSMNQQLDGVNL